MPQEESQEVKELRRQMREGRTPLLDAIREAYPPYLLARKSLERKNSEVRKQLGLLNSTFTGSIKKLRESARNTDDSGEGVLLLYQEMSRQAKAVADFIDKELPGLQKLFKPVSERYAYNTEVYCTDNNGQGWSEYDVADFFLHELVKGVSLRTIQKYLNNQGVLTRQGKLWHKGTLHNMALNPAYAGIAIGFRWKKKEGKKSMQLRAEEDTIRLPEGTIPPMITPAEREQILRQFELNKQTAARNSKFPEIGIMKGRVRCGTCGKSCHISHPVIRGRQTFSYQCRYMDQLERHTAPTVLVSLVDAAAWELATYYIKNPQLILERTEQIMSTQLDQEHTDRLNVALLDVTQRLKKLMEFALDATDEDVVGMVREKRQLLEKEKRDIERLLLLNLQDKEKEERVRLELEKFVGWCDAVRPCIDDPEYEISIREKRQAVAILGIAATIYPSDHTPRYTVEVGPTYIMEALVESGFEGQLEKTQVGSRFLPG